MNLRDLHYLMALQDTLHFGEAAKRCFVSQPTLSMQLKKLENTLGVRLMERNNKRVIFTDIGNTIALEAQKIIAIEKNIKQLANSRANSRQIQLKLSLIPTIAPYLLPSLLPQLKKNLPQLELLLHEEKTEDTLRLLN